MARTKPAPRRRAPPASPSPSTSNVSPIFSAQASVASGETPATSDGEVEIKTTRASSKRKAAVIEVESKIEEEDVETEGRPVRKRRATTRTAYVEIPYSPLSGKGKATKSAAPAASKGKGRARAKSPVVVESASSELSDDEDPIIEESEDSGSEFQASEAEDDVVDSSEDEAIMLAAAVEMSINSSRTKVASSSAVRLAPVNPEAAKRAAAAERRLSRRQQKMDVDDAEDAEDAEDMDDSPAPPDDMGWGSASEEEANSSGAESDEPLSSKKGKGKGKAKAPAKAKAAPAPVPLKPPKHMTLAELRKWKREQRRAAQSAKRANKAEEQALRRKLGRKLTQGEKNQIALEKHHPELVDVWGDVEASIPIVKPTVVDQPADLKLTLLPFQRESLSWMQKQEQGIWHGGMLADEMGMGKTIQMIALFLSDKAKPNLVIAPTVAIMQWRNELTTHTDSLKVLVWHGASRESNIKELKKYDVVLTTYAVLESCFRKQHSGFKRKGLIVKEKSPIHEVNWHRIVLDEAHNIKERSTNTARAAFNLKSNYKWCLSGTPLQNRVGELYSLVRFLGGDPFSYYFCKQCDCKSLHWKFTDKRTCDDCGHSPMQHTCFWNNEILTPIQKFGMAGTGRPAFKKLKILLDRVMLRRTKLQRADDLGLPPRTVIVRRDYFSPEEKELYLSLFSDAKRQFTTYLDQGTVLNNYSNIFSLLTRMRQMACHPDLVIRSKTNASKFIEDVGEATVCRLCNDIAEDAIQSKCRHIFDRECIKQYLEAALENQPACPVCHLPLTIDLEAPALEINENIDPAAHARQGILGRLNLDTWRSSTKIEALVEELTNLRKTESTTKSIVFSQFVNFLDLIAFRLQRAGFNICRLEGTMSPQARDATIQHFMNNVDVTVFLVSLKAGGVALNLTEASRVYLMDSWWNPAVEYQAMDRIHRLGQKRPVQAIKLVVEDSIESRIVQLQEKKSAMVDATLSTDDSAMGRLTPEDLGFLFRL